MKNLLWLLLFLSPLAFGQRNNCIDDLEPGGKYIRMKVGYRGCYILEGKSKSDAYEQVIIGLKDGFRNYCGENLDCRSYQFTPAITDQKCLQGEDYFLCHVVMDFTPYRKVRRTKDKAALSFIDDTYFDDKMNASIGFGPGSWQLDLTIVANHLDMWGYFFGLRFYKETITVAQTGLTSTSDLYSDPETEISIGAMTFVVGGTRSYRYKKYWIVPHADIALGKFKTAEDPWFGKDTINQSTGASTTHELDEAFNVAFAIGVAGKFEYEPGSFYVLKFDILKSMLSYSDLIYTLNFGFDFPI